MGIWLGIVIAAVASMVIGGLWYGPLFGKTWMKGVGMTEKDTEAKKSGMVKMYAIAFINSLVMMYVLSRFIELSSDGGVRTAIWIWLGFLLTQQVSAYLWSKESSLSVLLIGAGYQLVVAVVAALVMGLL